jgi:TRAP-type uncharacterized transport system substrate-binding protein
MQQIFNSIYWHPTLFRALVAIICLDGALWLVIKYFNTAPPSTITIATGPKGGAYESFAEQYREKLGRRTGGIGDLLNSRSAAPLAHLE